MSQFVAVAQLNDEPDDENEYTSELVILEGKELRIAKYNRLAGAHDYPALTALVDVLGFKVVTEWQALHGRAYAVVERKA